MKRSVINTNIEWAMDLCKRMHFNLPDFFYWTPEEWEAKKDQTEMMRKVGLGWDVTDYASGAPMEPIVCWALKGGRVPRL